MEVGDLDVEHQSSSSISSPPVSPPNDTIRVSKPPSALFGEGVGGANSAAPAAALHAFAHTTTTNAPFSNASTSTNAKNNDATADKPKRQRKKKEVPLGPDGKPIVEEKPKKPRKPREPKDKTTGANGTTTTAPRRKPKTEQKPDAKLAHENAPTQARQPTITEMVGTFQHPTHPASTAIAAQKAAGGEHAIFSNMSTQHRNSDGMIRSNLPPPTSIPAANPTANSISNPPTPRPVSSGQNYDPIRGAAMDARATNGTQPLQSSPHVNRASASPSIASLIDPPMTKLPTQTMPYSPTTQQPFVPSQQQSPPPPKPNFAPFAPPPTQVIGSTVAATSQIPNTDGAMDVEPICEAPKPDIPVIKAPRSKSASSSAAPTPKVRPTPEPPKGTGSGLLSTSDLFGGPSASGPSERKGVNIDIQIPLNPKGGNNINIAQEIIKKYGREAINPRAAAHREQLLRIAAEQERLGGTSNDEMSVDLMSEMEGDSNVEMGGMDDEKSNTGLDGDGKPARKRRKKVEEYDKEDDFIDDTELAWQEQAAVAKDGFFVYSGPLVKDGEQPHVESSAPSKGSRGRGRGRGSRSTTSGTTHASLADKSRDSATTTTTTSSRTRGTRGRGTGAPRKPRITKADRERLESEKADRERTAATMNGASNGLAATSSTLSSTPAAGPAPQLPSTSTASTAVRPPPQQPPSSSSPALPIS